MPRKLKAFSGWIISPRRWENRTRDGRPSIQCRAAVLVTSRKAAAAALSAATGSRITEHHIANYMGESSNPAMLDALSKHKPGTVLVAPMDPGGTILGQPGWASPAAVTPPE